MVLTKSGDPFQNQQKKRRGGTGQHTRHGTYRRPFRNALNPTSIWHSDILRSNLKAMQTPSRILTTVGLLFLSNIFMTAAWYGHLRFREVSMWQAILISWGIALFEYCLQVPANRI